MFTALTLTLATAATAETSFVLTVAGETSTGPLVLLSGWSDRFVSAVRTDRPRPSLPIGPHLILANGDRLPGRITGGDDLAIRFMPRLADGTTTDPWRIPLASIRVAWVRSTPAETPFDPDRYQWLPADRKKDVLLFRNGDVQLGDLGRVSDDGNALTWTPPGRVEMDRVTAFATNPALVVNRKPKGTSLRVVTTTGARLTLTAVTTDPLRLTGTTAFGVKADIPLEAVVAAEAVGGKSVLLSQLKPKQATTEPANRLAWPWVADRTVKGQPLRIVTDHGVETFDFGIGTHPRTTLVYSISGKYRRFAATVGMDAVSGRLGSAVVTVMVDGKAVERLELSGGKSMPLSVDVSGGKELMLVIESGPTGDVQADVNWGDARLVE